MNLRILTIFRPAILLVLLLAPLLASAHKMNVFAWAEDQLIYGEAKFSGGRGAKNITVTVEDAASGAVLLTTRTDGQGKFQFSPPAQTVEKQPDLLIIADAGDGHRAEWPLAAEEYLVASSAAADHPAKSSTAGSGGRTQPVTAGPDEAQIRRIVREEVNRQLAPVRQALAEEQQRKIAPQDILGGIGCIIGLAGLFAWLRSRKKQKAGQT
ncbi:MAG: hypothetical protein ACL93V_04205 [Candidatus Electrothrix sp. YB6]